MPILHLVPVFVLFLVLAVASLQGMRSEAGLGTLRTEGTGCAVTRVFDGDTVEMICPSEAEFQARLTGFDAPEIRHARCDAEAALGWNAENRLRQILASGSQVEVRFDGLDRFGRRLVTLEIDGVDLGDILVAEGLAAPYHGGPRPDWCARGE